MARIKQITERADVAPDSQYLYDRIAQARGRVAGPYSILLHSPAVAERVDAVSDALRKQTELTPEQFVLVALAVARAKDCVFVWSVQAPNARRAGVSDEAIAAIGGRRVDGLSAEQADIVTYARQVTAASRVDQALFDRLHARHGARWMVELTTAAGHFGLISGINNAFEVPASPQGEALPV